MSLLGFLAAGAARGASEASNKIRDVEVATDLEMNRESLRQQYYDRKVTATRESNRIVAETKAANDSARFDRERVGKVEDADRAFGRSKEIESIKNTGRSSLEAQKQGNRRSLLDATNDAKIKAKAAAAGTGGEDVDRLTYTSQDGKVYNATTPQEKSIALMQRLGLAADGSDAFIKTQQMDMVGNAAREMQSFTEGTVPTAGKMVDQVYGTKRKVEEPVEKYVIGKGFIK